MKVLFVVSECVPFVKSGGLADVAGSLPKEIRKLGADIRVILPKYGTIVDEYKILMKKTAAFTVKVGWRNQYCGIEELQYEGITFYFVDNEYYFNRENLYGYYDDGERFAFFNRAILDCLQHIDFTPDVIHCHDWHTGMVPFLLRVEYQAKKGYECIRTVFTIHNLKFQGIMPKQALQDLFGLSNRYFHIDQLEFYNHISFMKGAIVAADKITTVSPTYEKEIQVEYYGERLHELLKSREEDLQGILNGIDEDLYDPEFDSLLHENYHSEQRNGKLANKSFIQGKFGLPRKPDTPLVVMITRLTEQKGLDLVRYVFHELMLEDIQMIIIGTGDAQFEQFFKEMSHVYPDKCKAFIGFDETLAHQTYAAADLFLMPSKFEPCGLGQMIAMRYGAIPIVRETGGLKDSVQAFNELTGNGNGFSFSHYNAHDMLFMVQKALRFYRDELCWKTLVKNAMTADFSWAQSAYQYNQLYDEVISRSESHVF
ncbi:glycogen synthase GlgA [Cytobacillus depressus]|uniref:Glycogen synthase n=1 Tax=Cytobacillus depressus TaxID=1602942 RepID=A0A6L3VB77_9BACI|nr:glycogen synthase GlgA [Cytobacillus depressus]KAB2338926.1 glycogen synthase GlgA [Cytobacillus depressus]